MGKPPEPYEDWHSWALAQYDNDPRRAGLAARAAAEAQSIGAGMDAAIKAAESAAAAPPPSWDTDQPSIGLDPPEDGAQSARSADFLPDAAALGAETPPDFPAAQLAVPTSPLDEYRATTPTTSDEVASRQGTTAPPPHPEAKPDAKQTDMNSAETVPGTISPDGNYIWNGSQWVRNIPAASASVAGWHPDPDRPGGQRYFDGTRWTDHRTEPERPQVPQAPTALPPTQETLARRKRARRWWWTVVAIPVLVVLAFVIASRAQGGGATHTLTGIIHESPWIRPGSVQELLSLGPAADGQPCDGDITSPVNAVRHFGTLALKDGSGSSIATIQLGQGVIAGMGTGSVSCDFGFTFDGVPPRDGYEIVATSLTRDKTIEVYGAGDFVGTGWKVSITNNDY